MKKQGLFSVALLIMLVALAPVNAQQLYPTSHNFGDVTVGDVVITIVTLSNDDFAPILIDSRQMVGDNGFSVTSSQFMPWSLDYLESIDFEVTFAPTSVGEFSADLVIQNGEQFMVHISGAGVSDLPPTTPTILDIIQFFDYGVDSGTLSGVGPNNSAQMSKIKVFRKILWDANHILEEGNIKRACDMLNRAYNRCNDLRIPNDFIQGDAVSALSALIVQYIGLLGC